MNKIKLSVTPAVQNFHIFADIDAELTRARSMFPDTAHMCIALFEEVGELSKALLQKQCEPRKNVTHEDIYSEAIQVAVMAIRLASEGDSTLPNYDPESGYRGQEWDGYKGVRNIAEKPQGPTNPPIRR